MVKKGISFILYMHLFPKNSIAIKKKISFLSKMQSYFDIFQNFNIDIFSNIQKSSNENWLQISY